MSNCEHDRKGTIFYFNAKKQFWAMSSIAALGTVNTGKFFEEHGIIGSCQSCSKCPKMHLPDNIDEIAEREKNRLTEKFDFQKVFGTDLPISEIDVEKLFDIYQKWTGVDLATVSDSTRFMAEMAFKGGVYMLLNAIVHTEQNKTSDDNGADFLGRLFYELHSYWITVLSPVTAPGNGK